MTGFAKAMRAFFSSFGLPAYPDGSVPDSAKMPYITYSLTEPDWRSTAAGQARLWYHSRSYEPINAKIDEIAERVGEGLRFSHSGGFLWIGKGETFAQHMPLSNDTKTAYLSFEIQSFFR